VLVSACGGSSAPNVNPAVLLQRAKAKIDASSSVHFTLSSSNVTGGGTNLTGGSGDLARPDDLQGSFNVDINGLNVTVKAVSKGGVFEALLPFATKYVRTNPSNFGLTDPAQLLNSSNGLSSLLSLAQNPREGKRERISGELIETVTYTVPGTAIPVLPDANPSEPVTLVLGINPSNSVLRQVTLTGPFTSSTSNATYVVTLTNYDEHVTITLPPTS
jgi:LppX_LprAFG lipoprotein